MSSFKSIFKQINESTSDEQKVLDLLTKDKRSSETRIKNLCNVDKRVLTALVKQGKITIFKSKNGIEYLIV
jgi:hypothetical protein